jgi:hypothetical protein
MQLERRELEDVHKRVDVMSALRPQEHPFQDLYSFPIRTLFAATRSYWAAQNNLIPDP